MNVARILIGVFTFIIFVGCGERGAFSARQVTPEQLNEYCKGVLAKPEAHTKDTVQRCEVRMKSPANQRTMDPTLVPPQEEETQTPDPRRASTQPAKAVDAPKPGNGAGGAAVPGAGGGSASPKVLTEIENIQSRDKFIEMVKKILSAGDSPAAADAVKGIDIFVTGDSRSLNIKVQAGVLLVGTVRAIQVDPAAVNFNPTINTYTVLVREMPEEVTGTPAQPNQLSISAACMDDKCTQIAFRLQVESEKGKIADAVAILAPSNGSYVITEQNNFQYTPQGKNFQNRFAEIFPSSDPCKALKALGKECKEKPAGEPDAGAKDVEAKRKAAEAEAEAAKRKAEADAKQKAEAEAKQKAEADAEAKRKADAQAKVDAENRANAPGAFKDVIGRVHGDFVDTGVGEFPKDLGETGSIGATPSATATPGATPTPSATATTNAPGRPALSPMDESEGSSASIMSQLPKLPMAAGAAAPSTAAAGGAPAPGAPTTTNAPGRPALSPMDESEGSSASIMSQLPRLPMAAGAAAPSTAAAGGAPAPSASATTTTNAPGRPALSPMDESEGSSASIMSQLPRLPMAGGAAAPSTATASEAGATAGVSKTSQEEEP